MRVDAQRPRRRERLGGRDGVLADGETELVRLDLGDVEHRVIACALI